MYFLRHVLMHVAHALLHQRHFFYFFFSQSLYVHRTLLFDLTYSDTCGIGNWQPAVGANSSPCLQGAGGAEIRLQSEKISLKRHLREVIRWRGDIRLREKRLRKASSRGNSVAS